MQWFYINKSYQKELISGIDIKNTHICCISSIWTEQVSYMPDTPLYLSLSWHPIYFINNKRIISILHIETDS